MNTVENREAIVATSAQYIPLCPANALAPGEMSRFDPEGMDPIVLCNYQGEYYALEDECTHAIASMAEGEFVEDQLVCPVHGGRFCVTTGAATKLPCRQALKTWPISIVDGVVCLQID